MGMNMRDVMEMRQTIAPRVKNSRELYSGVKPYRLNPAILDAVGEYDPHMDDLSVLQGLESSGIEADLRDVAFARALL